MCRLRGDKNISTIPDLGNANVGTSVYPMRLYGVFIFGINFLDSEERKWKKSNVV